MDEINVHVVDYGRKNLYLRYLDPRTGKHVAKTSGTSDPKSARKKAGDWENDLRNDRYKPPSKVTWAEFRLRYTSEGLQGLSKATVSKAMAILDAVERLLSPQLLSAVPGMLGELQKKLRSEEMDVIRWVTVTDGNGRRRREKQKQRITVNRSEMTLKTSLGALRAALNWAHENTMLLKKPKFKMPKRAKASKAMKGRPITAEEFERMMAGVKAIRPRDADLWTRLLWGLWWSGLRISEAINLSWDRDDKPRIVLDGQDSMMFIPGFCQKSGIDEECPVAPEFVNFLEQTPFEDRRGPVFPLPSTRKDTISPVIVEIGKRAGVIVNTDQRGRVKHASAHDLRRSFGTRWANRVMPAVLQKLMRHANIETTLRFYVSHGVKSLNDTLWNAAGNTSGNFSQDSNERIDISH
jgi:integrase